MVKVLVVEVTSALGPARLTAPPVDVAVLLLKVLLVAVMALPSRLTAPPTPPALFIVNRVPALVLVTVLPDSPCTAPPSVLAVFKVKFVRPAVMRVALERYTPPPVVIVASLRLK